MSFSLFHLVLFVWMLSCHMRLTVAFRSSPGRHSPAITAATRRRRLLLPRHLPPYVLSGAGGGSAELNRQIQRTRCLPFSTATVLSAKKQQFSVIPNESVKKPYHLVVVESPSKCATIEKILKEYAEKQGLEYSFVVTSCLGHVRNLPSKEANGEKISRTFRFPYAIAGIDLEHNYSPYYTIIPGKEKVVRDLQTLANSAEKILLATDPDREGEAMAWHLQQVLGESLSYERISFTEITPSAVQRAISAPVSINPGLVQAQETRRILDRLAGFTVSPLLWKKIAPGLSAGRVQSVGMALVVQRERERLLFESTEYSSIEASFQQGNLTAQLRAIDDTPVASSGKDFASQGRTLTEASAHKLHLRHDNAKQFVTSFENELTEWKVTEVKASKRQQQPPQPYRTSTLQQDANRRLGLGVEQCMRSAQQLYENGLISYMRTDATYISEDAEKSLQQAVVGSYGRDMYEHRTDKASSKRKKESKFAQEAHEAIRPAVQPDGGFIAPESLELPQVAKELYQMIYSRTLACRMPSLITNLTQVTIEAQIDDTTGVFKTSGSVVLSPGWSAAYGALSEDGDDPEKLELPRLDEGQILQNAGVEAIGHETQPPPRYTEASFVKELEALGVGRPSTYAGIVKILRERAYVGSPSANPHSRSRSDVSGPAISARRAAGGSDFIGSPKGSLVPSLSAFAVCSLLENHCPSYVDSEFTSKMEERLDHIANSENSSEEERLLYLEEFYEGESGLARIVKRIEETVEGEDLRCVELPALLENEDGETREYKDVRLLVGPWGPYVQGVRTDRYMIKAPITKAPLPSSMAADLSRITRRMLQSILSTNDAGGYLLGVHPESGRNIRLKTGRFGAYLQCGEDGEPQTTTHSLLKNLPLAEDESDQSMVPEDYPPNLPILSFEDALAYSSLPKIVAQVDGVPVIAAIGPYGPYLKCNKTYANFDNEKDILTVDSETAESLMRETLASGGKKKPRGTLAELGEMEGSMLRVKNGRFGKYISWKKTNVKLPVDYTEDNMISLEEAWALVCEKTGGTPLPQKGSETVKTTDLPPPPKRPPSAYLLFCSDRREKIKEKKLSLGDSSKMLSKMWSELTEEERARFDAEAAVWKREYEREKVEWEDKCQRLTQDEPTQRKAKPMGGPRSSTATHTPKRPKSAYQFFCAEKRPEVSASVQTLSASVQTLGEVSKELARLWKGTTDRTKYEDLAAEDKARIEEENAGQSPQNGAAPARKTGQKSSPKPRRAPSAYMLFCKASRDNIVDEDGNRLPLGETTKRLASMWNSCDAETRQKFEQMALEEKERLALIER